MNPIARTLKSCVVVGALLVVTGCSGTPGASDSAQLMRLAEAARAGGDLGSAMALYQRARAEAPEDPAPAVGIGDTALAAGDASAATDAYAAAVALAPKDAGLRYRQGKGLLAVNRPGEAADAFRTAIDLDPADPRPHNGLGVALDGLGKHEEARAAYGKGLELAPQHVGLLNNLAFSWLISGEPDRAIALLRPLATVREAVPVTRRNLALAYGLAGDDAKAAAVAGLDLDTQGVRNNLALYGRLRAMSPDDRRKWLMAEIGRAGS